MSLQRLFKDISIFLLIVGGVVCAAEVAQVQDDAVDQRFAAIKVLHFPYRERTSYAFFKRSQVVGLPTNPPFPMQSNNLYLGLREQILAGYRLFPDMAVARISHKNFFLLGVREHISVRKPFLSEELEWWFARIAELLEKGASLSLTHAGDWEKMDKDFIKERLYPKGATRKWSVIAREKVHRFSVSDRVCIVFESERVALEGMLCRRSGPRAVDARSLLACKRRIDPKGAWDHAKSVKDVSSLRRWVDKRNRRVYPGGMRREPVKAPLTFPHHAAQPDPPIKDQQSGVETFFDQRHLFDHDLYVCCCAHGGGFGTSVRGSDLTAQVLLGLGDVQHKGVLTMREIFKLAFLRGYRLKRPQCGCENVQLLAAPQVRKVVCNKQAFVDLILQRALLNISQDLDLSHKDNDADKKEMQRRFSQLHLDSAKILWSIEDNAQLLSDLLLRGDVRPLRSGTVLCFMRGEPVALKGVLVSCTYKDTPVKNTLCSYWCEQILAPQWLRDKE